MVVGAGRWTGNAQALKVLGDTLMGMPDLLLLQSAAGAVSLVSGVGSSRTNDSVDIRAEGQDTAGTCAGKGAGMTLYAGWLLLQSAVSGAAMHQHIKASWGHSKQQLVQTAAPVVDGSGC
jgi:hypothetical protein